MAEPIKAPKVKNEPKKTKSSIKPIKTYQTRKMRSPWKKFLLTVFISLFFIFAALSGITYIKGYVYLPKLLNVDESFIQLPNKTNKAIIVNGETLSKFEQIKIILTNNLNQSQLFIKYNDRKTLPLEEGLNTIEIQRLLDFGIIKFGGNIYKTIITYDTTAPKLLSTPKMTNQGLVLEFTEPALVKILSPLNRTFKTDDSYTVVIPKKLLQNQKELKMQVFDNLGNSRVLTLNIHYQNNQNSTPIYKSKELPKSAGILENTNTLGLILLTALFGLPSIILIGGNKAFHKKLQ